MASNCSTVEQLAQPSIFDSYGKTFDSGQKNEQIEMYSYSP